MNIGVERFVGMYIIRVVPTITHTVPVLYVCKWAVFKIKFARIIIMKGKCVCCCVCVMFVCFVALVNKFSICSRI